VSEGLRKIGGSSVRIGSLGVGVWEDSAPIDRHVGVNFRSAAVGLLWPHVQTEAGHQARPAAPMAAAWSHILRTRRMSHLGGRLSWGRASRGFSRRKAHSRRRLCWQPHFC